RPCAGLIDHARHLGMARSWRLRCEVLPGPFHTERVVVLREITHVKTLQMIVDSGLVRSADVESALAKARDVAGPLRDGRGVERARASARGWRWWRGSGYKVTITEVDAQPVGRSTGCTQAARRSHTRIASRRPAATV